MWLFLFLFDGNPSPPPGGAPTDPFPELATATLRRRLRRRLLWWLR